jgi:hypothetical protein
MTRLATLIRMFFFIGSHSGVFYIRSAFELLFTAHGWTNTHNEYMNSSEFPEGILVVAREILFKDCSNLGGLVSTNFAEYIYTFEMDH